MYTPEHLTKWQRESDYGGEDLSNWYILIARTRDSNNLENSNFESIKKDLKEKFDICEDVTELNSILLASFGHWACGWIESLMIHEGNDAALILGDQIKEQLNDYPVYDEDNYQDREFEDYLVNCRDAIKGWLDSKDLEYNDHLINTIISQDGDWEMNGDFYPDDDQIEQAYNTVIHTKHCKECDSDYLDTNPCQCQIRMF
jgi:hypothetical protein